MAGFYLRRCHPKLGNEILRDQQFAFWPTAQAAASELTDRLGIRHDVVPADEPPRRYRKPQRAVERVVPLTAMRRKANG